MPPKPHPSTLSKLSPLMSEPKNIAHIPLLTELLEVAAESGDVHRVEALRATMGELALRKFLPEVAERAKQLEDEYRKENRMNVQNQFQGTINNLTMNEWMKSK